VLELPEVVSGTVALGAPAELVLLAAGAEGPAEPVGAPVAVGATGLEPGSAGELLWTGAVLPSLGSGSTFRVSGCFSAQRVSIPISNDAHTVVV
jgi:hypothetical protein